MKSNIKKKTARRVESSHGGFRPGAGRKPNLERQAEWGRVNCILKLKTIQALRDGAGAKNFGEFLQWHLERHPLPTHEVYQNILANRPIIEKIRGRKMQVIYTGTSPTSLTDPRMPRRKAQKPAASLSLAEELKARLEKRYGKGNDGNGEASAS